MPDKDRLVNTEKVRARLFELISYMSEAEKRELQSDLIYNMSEIERRKLLSILISNMTEPKRQKLLNKLEARENAKLSNKRQHPRMASLIAVDCETHELSFTNFIRDISNGGVFIETDAPFYVGQQIIMNFALPNCKLHRSIAVKSEIVRVDSRGIGVKFDRPLQCI